MANLLPKGATAPDFMLRVMPDQTLSLGEFAGRRIILAFYPADWSPVCGDQMSLHNHILPEFRRNGAELLGISVDGAWPEDDFFTPQIDTPASEALAAILSDGVQSLSPKQRHSWARFIISFAVRMPETLRQMGPLEARKGLEKAQDTAGGPPDLQAAVSKIIECRRPEFERNWPLMIAMELASDPEKIAAVIAMDWWIRRLDRDDILVGDRPLLAMPRMDYPCGIPLTDPGCLVILPIAPNALFFASTNPKTRANARKMSPSRLAHIVNEETIDCAHTYVYSLNSSPSVLVESRLAQKRGAGVQPATLG